MPVFTKQELVKYFRGLYITKVKDAISSYVIHKQISVLEINAYIDELSGHMKERIEPIMAEYGIKLVNFYVNDLSVPDDDPAVKTLKGALAKKAEMDIIGYNYQQERSFDTLEGAATNPGSNSAQLMGAGMGLGMGVGMGGSIGGAFGNVAQAIQTKGMKLCPKCGAQVEADKRFCGGCGFDLAKQEKEAEKPEPIKLKCSSCGAELNKASRFCSECGKKYNPCPKCGADLKEGAKNCPECGYELPRRCPKCDTVLPGNVKFCPECGEALETHCPKCDKVIEGEPKFCPECGEKLR